MVVVALRVQAFGVIDGGSPQSCDRAVSLTELEVVGCAAFQSRAGRLRNRRDWLAGSWPSDASLVSPRQ